jgi:hypothetical protein
MPFGSLENLSRAYELALAQAFYIDDVYDGDVEPLDTPILPILRHLEVRLASDVLEGGVVGALSWPATQAVSLRDEFRIASSESVEKNLVGRSAPVMTYLGELAAVSDPQIGCRVVDIVESYIVLAQNCDDLSDWEQDLLKRRFTPTATKIIGMAGMTVASFDETYFNRCLRAIYFNGGLISLFQGLRNEAARLLREIDELPTNSEPLFGVVNHLAGLIDMNYQRAQM